MEKDLVNEVSKQIVHNTSLFKMDDEFKDERFCKVRIAAMHTGINRNGSRFSKKCVEKAKNTFKNIPILADIQEYKNKNGEYYLDYAGHSMHIENDKFDENESRIIYDEKVVGIVPENNNFEIVYDEENDNYVVYVDALLYRDYGNYCCDILEQKKGTTDVSMEIDCDDVSYSAKDKCLDVGIMKACAITLLGENITPGMKNAHAVMFSFDIKSIEKQTLRIMQELKESLDNYTNFTKGGTDKVENENINLENAEITEDTVIETESTEEEVTVETTEEEATVNENFTDNTTDVTPDDSSKENEENKDNEIDEESDVDKEDEKEEKFNLEYSISLGEKSKSFAVSLSDIQYAISELVNETYSDEITYYGCEVYMDESYVIMQDYYSGMAYKQSFKKKKGCGYQLIGDRIQVKAVYLTEDEEKELDNMRSKYSALEQFKNETEEKQAHSEREEVMMNDKYSIISSSKEVDGEKVFENESYGKLYSEMDKYSCEELEEKLKIIIGEYALNGGNMNFSSNKDYKNNFVPLTLKNNSKKKKNYGNLFDDIL